MAAWRDGATVTVEIAFTNPPLTANASCTWVDVTQYVRGWSTRRGRTSELSPFSPGTAQVVLDNRSRLFDPSNTAGTYYGQLLPMRKIRISASSGATSATVFNGFVMGWPIEYPGMLDSTVTLQCVDAFRILSQATQPVNGYEAKVLADSPLHYWPLDSISDGLSPATVGGVDIANFNQGDPAYFAPADLAITRPVGPSITIANAGWAATGTSATAPKTVEGWFWNMQYGVIGGNNIARAAADSTNWIRLAVSSTNGTVSVGYSNSTDSKSYAFASIGWRVTASVAHLVLTATSTTLTLYANGIQVWQGNLSVGTSTNTFPALPPPSVQAVAQPRAGSPVSPAIYGLAVYSTNLTSTQVTDHYFAGLTGYGHPAGDRGGARIERILDAIGWPAGDRAGLYYLDGASKKVYYGVTVLGPWDNANSPLTACQAIADTEQGYFFVDGTGNITFRDRQWILTNTLARTAQATLGDSTGETPYFDIEIDGNHLDWIRNVVTVSFSGSSVTVKDTTSVTAYGEQGDSVSASNLPSFAGYVARQLAAYRLRARKDAKTRIPSVKVKPRTATATHLPTLLSLELGYRVTVKRRPTGGTGTFSQDCTVQGISHQVSADNWVTTLYLAPTVPSYTEGPYLTLGDATYGRIGFVYSSGTAGNKIPY